MPSMSYCMFENTVEEMTQIIDTVEQAETISDLDLNSYEQDAFIDLVRQCSEFVERAKQLVYNEELLEEDQQVFTARIKKTLREIEFMS